MRKAIIRDTDGFVTNIIDIETGANWQPPVGYTVINAGNCSPGDTWDGINFIKPELPEPPLIAVTHWARVDSFEPAAEKPLIVKRLWLGVDRIVACYVSQEIKDEYQVGGLVIGDFVLVVFVDGDISKPLALTKIYKTW